jgi:hypothetical protein
MPRRASSSIELEHAVLGALAPAFDRHLAVARVDPGDDAGVLVRGRLDEPGIGDERGA